MTTIPRKIAKRPAKRALPAVSPSELDVMIVDLKDMRDEVKGLEIQIKEKQADVLIVMDKQGLKSHKVKIGKKVLTAVRQQNHTLVYDEDKLRKRLGASLWNKITTRVLDKKKLEAFVASGEISTTVLAACSEEKPSNPFVKVT
jgi:regulator of replication initiation timing